MVLESFRKRQKEMMGALVLLAIFVFIGGDFFQGCSRQNRIDAANPVYGSVWNTEMRKSDLDRIETERMSLFGAVQRSLKAVGDNAKRDQVQKVLSEEPWRSLSAGGVDWRLAYAALHKKADQLGLTATDQEVNELLMRWTGNSLSRKDFVDSLAPPKTTDARKRDRSEPLTEPQFFSLLARELKVYKAISALTSISYDVTPLDLWKTRLQDGHTSLGVEAVRIPTEKFIDAKAEPTPKELDDVYKRYKDKEADVERGVVGFRLPATVEYEYISVSVDRWVDDQKVPEGESRKYYNEHMAEFLEDPAPRPKKAATPDSKSPVVPPPPPPGKTEEKKSDAKPADKKPDPTPSEKTAPKSPDPVPAKKSPETPSAPKGKQSSAYRWVDLIPYLSNLGTVVSQDKAKGAAEKATPPKTEETTQKSDAKKADDKKPAPEKSNDKKAADKTPPPPAKTSIEERKNSPPPVPVPPIGKSAAGEGMERKIKPYETVRAEIEKKLKRQKAREAVIKMVAKITDEELKPYADQLVLARRAFQDTLQPGDVKGMENFKPPAMKRSLQQLAKELRGEYTSGGPATEKAVGKLEGVGKVMGFKENLFNTKRGTYAIESTTDIFEDVFYLYWKTKFTPGSAPELAAVQSEATKIWRKEQAEKPAKKFAEELAEKIRKEGSFEKGLKGTDYKPFRVKDFQRAQYIPTGGNPNLMSQMQRIPLTQIDGLPDGKREFIDKAFNLEVNGVDSVRGADGENFYVIKCVKRVEPELSQFAWEYGGVVEKRNAQDQQYMIERNSAATAYRVLLESGYTAPTATTGKDAGGEEDSM